MTAAFMELKLRLLNRIQKRISFVSVDSHRLNISLCLTRKSHEENTHSKLS